MRQAASYTAQSLHKGAACPHPLTLMCTHSTHMHAADADAIFLARLRTCNFELGFYIPILARAPNEPHGMLALFFSQ